MKAGELQKTTAVIRDAYARLGLKRPFRKTRYVASDLVSFELECDTLDRYKPLFR